MVLLLHRDDVYQPDPALRDYLADLIVAKHRNGATRNIKLVFQGHLSRFANNPDEQFGPANEPDL
jgi:replicative DNA helicase